MVLLAALKAKMDCETMMNNCGDTVSVWDEMNRYLERQREPRWAQNEIELLIIPKAETKSVH